MIDSILSATVQELDGMCPSCQTRTTFTHIGEQHWPEAVAQANQMNRVQQLYRCEHCHTSLAEASLRGHTSHPD